MNLNDVLAQLPSLSVEQRQQVIRRALELDEAALPPAQIAVAEARLSEMQSRPEANLSLEQIEARLRNRFKR